MANNKSASRPVIRFPKEPTKGELLGERLTCMDLSRSLLWDDYHAKTKKIMEKIASERGIDPDQNNWEYAMAISLAKELYTKKRPGTTHRLTKGEEFDLVLDWRELQKKQIRPTDIPKELIKNKRWKEKFHTDQMKPRALKNPQEAIRKYHERLLKKAEIREILKIVK